MFTNITNKSNFLRQKKVLYYEFRECANRANKSIFNGERKCWITNFTNFTNITNKSNFLRQKKVLYYEFREFYE
jgi:hypothetical protein